jgi:hypothetical protein
MRLVLIQTGNVTGDRHIIPSVRSDRACNQSQFSTVRLTPSLTFTDLVLNEIMIILFAYFETQLKTQYESHSLKIGEVNLL